MVRIRPLGYIGGHSDHLGTLDPSEWDLLWMPGRTMLEEHVSPSSLVLALNARGFGPNVVVVIRRQIARDERSLGGFKYGGFMRLGRHLFLGVLIVRIIAYRGLY